MSAAVLDRLLRAPGDIAASCRRDTDIRPIALTSLAAIVLGAAAFGGVLGSFRGGAQIAYGAIKVPLAVIATLAFCTPAFHALAAVLGRPWPLRSVISLTLAAAGRSSLVLLAFTPALWLALDVGIGYHAGALAASLAYGLAGLAALGVLVRGIGAGQGRVLTALAFIGMFFAVGGQTAWILRPYLVRPKTPDAPFLRSREGGFSDALFTSGRSAAGIYDHEAPVLKEPSSTTRIRGDEGAMPPSDVTPTDLGDPASAGPNADPNAVRDDVRGRIQIEESAR